MKIYAVALVLACMLASTLQAAVRPEFAEPATLPAYGVLVLPVQTDMKLPGALGEERSNAISRAATAARFEPEAGKVITLHGVAGYDTILLLGLGDEALSPRDLQDLGGRMIGTLGRDKHARASILFEASTEAPFPAAEVALGLQLGGYRFDKYKSPGDESEADKPDTRYVIFSESSEANRLYWAGNRAPVADGVYFARDLINEPANIIYPESFVERTREAFRGVKDVTIKVLDVRDMERLARYGETRHGRPPRGRHGQRTPATATGRGIPGRQVGRSTAGLRRQGCHL
jgi:leucyl aminopeptidase